MKKFIVLLIMAVLFTACEPTTGSSGGPVIEEFIRVENTKKNGDGTTELRYGIITFTNSSKYEWTERTVIQIENIPSSPDTCNIAILKEKKQANPFLNEYWNSFSIIASNDETSKTIHKDAKDFLLETSITPTEYGYHYHIISSEFLKLDFTHIESDMSVQVNVEGLDPQNNITLTLPPEFLEMIATYILS